MNKMFLACVAMAGIAAAPARAADLPPYPPPPPVAVGVPDCWTGFYFGGNLGYHGGQDIISASANPFGWGPDGAGIIDDQSATWLGGAANRQFTFVNAVTPADGDFMYNSTAANVVATLRGRLGVAFNSLLV